MATATTQKVWGFLRETSKKAEEAGIDKDTDLCRTGLNEYLKAIFPDTSDWIHDQIVDGLVVDGKQCRLRPDYRSVSLNLIIEFNGLPHYQNPDIILKDTSKFSLYTNFGYRVVAIPYFIQLSKKVIKRLFNIEMGNEMFDDTIPSLGISGRCTPAYLCPLGVRRMAKEFFEISPEQYDVNVNALKAQGNVILTGVDFLESEWRNLNHT